MIKKEQLMMNFPEEGNNVTKIYEKYKLAYEKGIPLFLNEFVPPNIWMYFIKNQDSNISIQANGLFEEAERRILSFNNNYNLEFPIKTIKIKNKSSFSNLKHKDYLGSILSLGIERHKIGDIVVKENEAYLPVVEDISDYILSNLNSIGKSPVSIEILDDKEVIPNFEFETLQVNIASLRVDSLVSKLANVSRSKAVEAIEEGKVLINYSKSKDKSQDIQSGDRITIRGIGKFIVGDLNGTTRSGKEKILIKKYI